VGEMNSFTMLLESAILETEIKGCTTTKKGAEGKFAARDKVAIGGVPDRTQDAKNPALRSAGF
jgi:hypothetical protein